MVTIRRFYRLDHLKYSEGICDLFKTQSEIAHARIWEMAVFSENL